MKFAEESSNKYSTANINWEPLETYKTGQVLELNIVMNAYHVSASLILVGTVSGEVLRNGFSLHDQECLA